MSAPPLLFAVLVLTLGVVAFAWQGWAGYRLLRGRGAARRLLGARLLLATVVLFPIVLSALDGTALAWLTGWFDAPGLGDDRVIWGVLVVFPLLPMLDLAFATRHHERRAPSRTLAWMPFALPALVILTALVAWPGAPAPYATPEEGGDAWLTWRTWSAEADAFEDLVTVTAATSLVVGLFGSLLALGWRARERDGVVGAELIGLLRSAILLVPVAVASLTVGLFVSAFVGLAGPATAGGQVLHTISELLFGQLPVALLLLGPSWVWAYRLLWGARTQGATRPSAGAAT